MFTPQLLTENARVDLLSKEEISLPPKQRLMLLLQSSRYVIVQKRTSAKRQIKEMLDFFNFCRILLLIFFPSEKAENEFVELSFMSSHDYHSIIFEQFEELFKLLEDYEMLESRITSMQMLFYQYKLSFPDLYDRYNLENIDSKKISEIIQESRLLIEQPDFVANVLKRWDLLS